MPHTWNDVDDLVRIVAALLTAVIVCWHLTGLACCALSRRGQGGPALARAGARLAPPLVRRLAGVAGATTLVLTPATAHAAPMTAAAPPAEVPFVRAPAVPAVPSTTTSTTPPAPARVPAVPEARRTVETTKARMHVVAPGDNLWRIAAAELARVHGGAKPSDAAIVRYWRAVIAANRATLRSGDPSLIHPGEVVALPSTR